MSIAEDTHSHPQENPDGAVEDVNKRSKDIESWLPVTASRKGKWWYSTFHNVTAMVGAGVLGLPFAMSQLGWVPGITAIACSWLITFYTMWQLVQLHEVVPGKRFDRYHELGQHAFGPKLGFWIVAPLQSLVQVSSDIVYMVTGGKSLKKFCDIVAPVFGSLRKSYFIIFFACIQLFLSQIPNFNSLSGLSLLAAFMSFCYSSISFIASIIRGRHHSVDYSVRSSTSSEIAFNALNALGAVAFAFAGHSVALEIQATIPSTAEKPSTRPMWHGIIGAYIILALCYFSVSICGYWAFGNLVEDDILISLEKPDWLIGMANLMVFFHVIGSYQIFAMPIFDMIESCLVKKANLTPGFHLRLIGRSSYVFFTAVVGICVPFFGGLLGFFGGLVFTSTTYSIPSVMWIILKKPKRFSFHWIASLVCITVGVLLTVLTPIGGLRQIIHDAKGYKFFS